MESRFNKFRRFFGSGGPEHSLGEDLVAMAVGVLLISLALVLYQRAGLLTGGISGISLIAHYTTGIDLGKLFFVLNIPFYWLAARKLGRAFMLKTFAGVAATSVFTELIPRFISIAYISQPLAGILGGVLLGTGFLILFRHRMSLGGFGILVIYLQDRYGWSAGKIQMCIDCCIVSCAFFVVPVVAVVWSIVGAVVLNLVLSMNHRKDRYVVG